MKSCKTHTLTLLAVLLLAPAVAPAQDISTNTQKMSAAETSKPNVIFFLFDDMGYGQPQCYNPKSVFQTPNLDRLARQGMRFTDAHSASAVCTPSRYGVLTGRYPSRIGQFGVLSSLSAPIIPTNRLTVASMLKQQGYATACIGKWHLGMNWGAKTKGNLEVGDRMTDGPNALGFDYFYGYTHAQEISSVIEQDRVVAELENEYENQPLMIKKAVEWIGQRKKDEPFFLYFPVCPPHAPVVPAPEYVGKVGALDKDPKYGDWIYQGDAMLGQIMEALEKNQLADNTILIVTADNGAAGRAYAPLKASKRSIYEGGHRVPYVVRWPGKVKVGSTWDRTICLNDFVATMAEITGATIPADAAEDSVSILPALLGKTDTPTREATVHQSMAGDLAIRKGPWKVIFMTDGKQELYNLEKDLSETTDVSREHPEKLQELTVLMQRYIDSGRSTSGEAQRNEHKLTLGKRGKITKAHGGEE